tara:strand:+ start:3345 stop:3512 length:168 start_codon:yes stop_codon:yes gene_type:complete
MYYVFDDVTGTSFQWLFLVHEGGYREFKGQYSLELAEARDFIEKLNETLEEQLDD